MEVVSGLETPALDFWGAQSGFFWKKTKRQNSLERCRVWTLLGLISYVFPGLLLVHRELLFLHGLELIAEVELGGLLLQFGELVLVFGNLLQGRFNAAKRTTNWNQITVWEINSLQFSS